MKNVKVVFLIVAIVFVAVVVIQNTEEVVTQVLFAEIRLPRAVLLIVTFAVGFAVGAVATLKLRNRGKPPTPAA